MFETDPKRAPKRRMVEPKTQTAAHKDTGLHKAMDELLMQLEGKRRANARSENNLHRIPRRDRHWPDLEERSRRVHGVGKGLPADRQQGSSSEQATKSFFSAWFPFTLSWHTSSICNFVTRMTRESPLLGEEDDVTLINHICY